MCMKIVLAILFALIVPMSLFQIVYHIPFFYTTTDFSPQEKQFYVDEFTKYLDGRQQLSQQTIAQMSEEEIIHMQDVARLFFIVRVVNIILLIITILLLTQKNIRKELTPATKYASIGIFAFLIISGIVFKPFFLFFHKLIFTNNYWFLPLESLLIRLFPQSTFFLIYTVTLLSSSLILFIIHYKLKHHETYSTKTKNNKRNAL